MSAERLTYKDGKFYFKCLFENRHLAKSALLTFNKLLGVWETPEVVRAQNLIQYADERAFRKIIDFQKLTLATRVFESDYLPPAPEGLEYLPYQRAGIEYLLPRSFAFIADEQGLGKTIQAIGLLNAIKAESAAVVSPVSLLRNWEKEFSKWTTSKEKMAIIRTEADFHLLKNKFIVLSYGLFQDENLYLKLKEKLGERKFEVFFSDESHYIKNPDAKRTKAILGDFAGRFNRHYFISGTPIEGRPVEIFPILNRFRPDLIDHISYWGFAKTYNGAYEGDFGWQLGKGTNLDILNSRLREHCFLRRMKADVLKDLPEKIVSYNYLDINEIQKKLILEEVKEAEHIATARKKIGLSKVKHSVEYIKNLLEGTEKVVVFAWHTEVIDALKKELKEFNPVSITGETPAKDRDTIKEKFQNDESCRVFIGNIQAAGVGLTLTAASTVVFVEVSWLPTQNEQAMDRCHRIGQLNCVNVYFLLLEGSNDDRVIKSCMNKWKDFKKLTA